MKKVIKRIVKCILLVFGGLFIAVLLFGVCIYLKYRDVLLNSYDKAQSIAAAASYESFRAAETSLLYASDGSLITSTRSEKEVFYLPYEYIPTNAINAMLATEDRKFYSHSGYDIYAILRAVRALIINKGEVHQGGSTITQQLARAVFLNNDVTLERKVTEIFLAAALEERFSKNEILEFYMNNIYFANGYYGLQAAANGYFGKSAGELSLSETAFICTIPNNPSLYDPLKNIGETLTRRDSILEQMHDQGMIGDDDYTRALAEKINLNRSGYELHDYVETYAYHCAVKKIMESEGFVFRYSFNGDADREAYETSYSERYYSTQRRLFTGGYRIYTSIEPKLQSLLTKSIDDGTASFTETGANGVYALQSAGVCIDNDTGRVAAIVGGRSQDLSGYTLNRAYQSPRQPGSSIKPLIVYLPALEHGYTSESRVLDEKFEGGPRNSGGVYSGEITLEYAVVNSKNTIAWKLFEELTPEVGLSYLKKMHFSHIVDTDYVPAASLGGLTYGVTAIEMASAYSAIENNGILREPTCIVKIMDASGRIVAADTISDTVIYEPWAAREMTAMLKKVFTEGTARKVDTHALTEPAGKTGTTNDQKDGWFCGFTKEYTTAVWVGYDLPRAVDDLMGNTYPAAIWSQFMNKIYE